MGVSRVRATTELGELAQKILAEPPAELGLVRGYPEGIDGANSSGLRDRFDREDSPVETSRRMRVQEELAGFHPSPY